MAQTDEFGEELEDFVRRVAELKAARSVPSGDLQTVLDAALFELDHVAGQLWPWYERLNSGGGTPNGPSTDRQEQQLLRAIFQRLPLPVAMMDRETVVRRLNHSAAQFTGIRSGYATGRSLTGFLAHADRAAFRSQVAAVARGEGDRSLTVHLQQRPSVSVRATLTAVRTSGEPRTSVLMVLQPEGPRVPSAEGAPGPLPDLAETTRHAAQLDLVDAMSTALLAEPAKTRAAVLEQAARVLHGRFADWVITDEGAARLCRMTVLGPTDQPGTQVEELQAQDPASCPLVVEAARGGSTALQVRPDDPDAFGKDASGAPVLVSANVTSLLCVPLTVNGAVQGVITLFRCGARLAFSMAEAQILDMMSRHIALALRNLDRR
ncbi:GAF domain-containing protein [Streptomyces sp. NPDC048825]|uniref:GAF domain-containing protein n=1 Tax=Streptomyces sp. NPDC048825 TaxID=3365592 RepID=UPI003710D654